MREGVVMAQHGKRYREAIKRIERGRLYDPEAAIALLKDLPPARFDETVEAHIRLGIDPKQADQQVRGTVVLPHGTGKTVRVLVFARGDKVREALEAGADYAGLEELVEKIQGGWLDFDTAVATPDVMGVVGRLGRILGPRGLMPNPKAGKIEYRVDRYGLLHVPIGKVSFSPQALLENFATLIHAVVRSKPPASKGQYLRSITLATTMGPGIPVDPSRATAIGVAGAA